MLNNCLTVVFGNVDVVPSKAAKTVTKLTKQFFMRSIVLSNQIVHEHYLTTKNNGCVDKVCKKTHNDGESMRQNHW